MSALPRPASTAAPAKYAAEFNVPGLAHGSVITSTIAKGRIARLDTSEALRVEGVIDVLTHQNRPRMARTNDAYKDDVAPEGAPFRPLYDDTVLFSGQPIALVVAEELEIAQFAALLVRVEYEEEAHVTDVFRARDDAFALQAPANPAENPFAPPKPRGDAETAFAAAEVRHKGEYYVPIEHHNPMELFASTVMFEPDGKLTIYDKTQGVQNVQRYVCSVLEMEPDEVRVMSPFMGGGFGSGLRPQHQVVLAALAARKLKRSVRRVAQCARLPPQHPRARRARSRHRSGVG
jgi:xanthine dehydrogenase YagR molybdenum-binding subunit